ncbi:DUF6111 family protein [Roseibium sp.]|uniref:DUF6111 family protein n=1 Tax=Roseibium sp. TaxID=1936156 RepID=UPI003D147A3D
MLRIVFTQLLLFLIPFVCYGAWLWLSKKSRHPESWSRGPIAWLTLAGLALVIAGLVAMAQFDRAPEGTSYRPSEMRDGVFVPGRFE